MCVAKGSSPSHHYTKGRKHFGGGSSDFKNRAISREHGPTVYKFDTWDCDVEGHYLDKLKLLLYFGRQGLVS
jgi:hypothetical protein